MKSILGKAILLVGFFLQLAQASIHFYLEPKQVKCFLKEMTKDSMIVMRYQIEASDDNGKTYRAGAQQNLELQFVVEELFDNDHRVSNQRGGDGQFIFTALDTGTHKICLSPVTVDGYQLAAKSRISLDVTSGGQDILQNPDTKKLTNELNLRQLYEKLNHVKVEYMTFRGREAAFRDMSEAVNSSAVKWVIIQIIVLCSIGYFQLHMLKTFFIKEKVV